MNISIQPAAQVIDAPPASDGAPADDLRGVVVRVDGDVDIYTAPMLLRAVQGVLATPIARRAGGKAAEPETEPGAEAEAEGQVTAVIVDLTEVEFIDSAALGVLVQGHHLVRRSGCDYALVANHPMIHTLFEITGLAKVLPLHPGVAAAMRSLRPAAQRP